MIEEEKKWLLRNEVNNEALLIYKKKGKFIKPKSLEDKKDIFYYLPILTCYSTKSIISFNAQDLHIYYKLVVHSSIQFQENEGGHQDDLTKVYALLFNKNSDNIINDENWKRIGFQNPKPGSDFRGGGYLSLQTLHHIIAKEPDLIKEVIEFNDSGNNYLFACIVISGVFFLKNYLHFGLHSNYKKKLDSGRTCKRRVFKYFISLDFEDSFEQSLNTFNEVVRVYNIKLFKYWKQSCEKDPRLTIMDFKNAEEEIQRILQCCFEEQSKNHDLEDRNSLKKFLDHFEVYTIDKVIQPTIIHN